MGGVWARSDVVVFLELFIPCIVIGGPGFFPPRSRPWQRCWVCWSRAGLDVKFMKSKIYRAVNLRLLSARAHPRPLRLLSWLNTHFWAFIFPHSVRRREDDGDCRSESRFGSVSSIRQPLSVRRWGRRGFGMALRSAEFRASLEKRKK